MKNTMTSGNFHDEEFFRAALDSIEITFDKGTAVSLNLNGCDTEYLIAVLSHFLKALSAVPPEKADSVSFDYDLFISHASEDKIHLIDPLVEKLRKLGIRVWYDKDNIQCGDSFRPKIDEGILHSRFVLIILSPSYIRKYWTQQEFNAFMQIESVYGKRIVPVWHHVTSDQVLNFSPMLASRCAMNTDHYSIAELAIELAQLVRSAA